MGGPARAERASAGPSPCEPNALASGESREASPPKKCPRLAPSAHEEARFKRRWLKLAPSQKLFGRDGAHDTASLLAGSNLDFAMLQQSLHDTLHYAVSLLNVSDFTSSENDRDLHFVPVLKKLDPLVNLEINIVHTRFWAQTYFLSPRVMDVPLGMFLAALVLVFAVVHDTANWRILVRSDLHEIQTNIFCPSQSILGRNDTQL